MDGTRLVSEFVQPWHYLDRAAKLYPNRAGIADLQRTVSYEALRVYAKQMAAMFRHRGVRPGDLVALDLPVLTQTVATFAIFHEAAVYLPYIPAAVNAPNFDVAWVVTTKVVEGFPVEKQIVLSDDWIRLMSRESVTSEPIPYESKDSVIRIAFSSGTTGTPKGMPYTIEHTEYRATHNDLIDKVGRGKAISLMTPRRGVGWNWWYASFVNQTTYPIISNPREVVEMLVRFKIHGVQGSPAQYRLLVDELKRSGRKLPDLRVINSAGSGLPDNIYNDLRTLTNAVVTNGLGATEVGLIARTTGERNEVGYVGEIDAGTDLQIVDSETHAPLPDGSIGLLRVRRAIMCHEYYNDPEATAIAFRDGWFYPGDFARREGNELYLEGRASERINVGGVKIDPAKIDAKFLATGLVAECAVFAVSKSGDLDEVHLAYVSDEPVDESALATVLAEELRQVNPQHFHRVPEIPRTDMAKPVRHLLARKFGA